MTGPTRLWELRTVEGGANGLEFARSRLDAVHDQVLELLFAAHVAVERAGDHPETRAQGTHG